MAFKINVSHQGKTYKVETESEILVGKKIGETFKGEDIDENLKGFELQITGTSDLSGIPGFKGLEGTEYHRELKTFGPGMKDKRKGMRLRKTLRGEEISLKTHQINTKLIKEGDKKFKDLITPTGEIKEEPAEEPTEPEKKEEKPESDEKSAETKEPAEQETQKSE